MRTRLLQQAPIPMRLFIGILYRFAQTSERVTAGLVQLVVAPEFVDTAGQLNQNGSGPHPAGWTRTVVRCA